MAFASPKSSTFTVPSSRTLTFAGFRSRWMMPLLVRGLECFRDLFRVGSASLSGMGPLAIRSPSVGPSTSSMTSACVLESRRRRWAMFG